MGALAIQAPHGGPTHGGRFRPVFGYTQSMKTAISLSDELFAEADRLARRLKRSRSRVYADAIREYVARHDSDSVTAGLNRVYSEPDVGLDPVLNAAAERLLQRVDW